MLAKGENWKNLQAGLVDFTIFTPKLPREQATPVACRLPPVLASLLP